MTIQKCPRYRFDNKKTFKERRIVIKRSWVRIPAPDTGWKIFTLICCKNGIVCLKRPKINKKEAGHGHFLKKTPLKDFVENFFVQVALKVDSKEKKEFDALTIKRN